MANRSNDEAAGAATGSSGVVIETARLRVRSYRDDDLADLVALAGNWEITRWVATIPHPYTEADGREWIARVQENHATGRPHRFAIALKKTDRLIGGVGLDGTTGDGSEEPALGYWLGQPYWGNGYAREAAAAVIDYGFRTLGLETIRAYTDPGNAASQRVLLHCGLKRIGRSSCLSRHTMGNGAHRYFASLGRGHQHELEPGAVDHAARPDTGARHGRRRASLDALSRIVRG